VRDGLLLAMTLMTGYMDAISYLGLERVFTANMTGNLVLLGLAAGEAAGLNALWSGVALLGFVLGVAVGARVIGRSRERVVWPRRVTIALGVEVVLLAGFAAGWHAAAARPSGLGLAGLIAGAAVAMGIQSTAARRLGVSGVSTTYVTGTLTRLVSELAPLTGVPAGWARWTGVLGVLAAGAAIGAVTVLRLPSAAALVPVFLLAAVTITAAIWYRPSSRTAEETR
jgi:uncharacterized membrane protein YoaK (UPF0700 family)